MTVLPIEELLPKIEEVIGKDGMIYASVSALTAELAQARETEKDWQAIQDRAREITPACHSAYEVLDEVLGLRSELERVRGELQISVKEGYQFLSWLEEIGRALELNNKPSYSHATVLVRIEYLKEQSAKLAAAEAELLEHQTLIKECGELLNPEWHRFKLADLVKENIESWHSIAKERDALREQVARLEADGKRLDWLESYNAVRIDTTTINGQQRKHLEAPGTALRRYGSSLREAINAALAQSGPVLIRRPKPDESLEAPLSRTESLSKQ